jgi:hypothetical protein
MLRNFRKAEEDRIGAKESDRLGQDDRLLKHFNIVNPLPFAQEGLVMLTNDGLLSETLRDTKVIYNWKI